MDPCEILPIELFSAILALLPYKILYNCIFVSYRWNILGSPFLWGTLRIRFNTSWSKLFQVIEATTPPFPAFSPISELSNPLDTPSPTASFGPAPSRLAHRYGTYVKYLDFLYCGEIVNDHLFQVLAERCPNLVTLIVVSPKRLTDCAILTIARSPCARTLRHVALRCTSLTDDSLTVLLAETSQLCHLELSQSPYITNRTLHALPTDSPLVELDCFATNLKISDLYTPLKRCTKLQALDLGCCQGVTDTILAQVARACGGTLRILKLSGCRAITDTGLKALVDHGCEALEYLDVSACSGNITEEGILAVIEGCMRLTYLCITDTYEGISRDCLKRLKGGRWRGLGEEVTRKVRIG